MEGLFLSTVKNKFGLFLRNFNGFVYWMELMEQVAGTQWFFYVKLHV